MQNTLILNSDYTPLNVVPLSAKHWTKAVEILWKGKATVLHEYEDWVVRSPSVTMNVPAVLLNHSYSKPKRFARFSKENIHLRDNHMCQYCFKSGVKLTFDHVRPQSFGGPKTWENIITACSPCNNKRGNNEKIRPHYEPYKPSYWELVEARKKQPIVVPHISWTYYLDWDPELVTVSSVRR